MSAVFNILGGMIPAVQGNAASAGRKPRTVKAPHGSAVLTLTIKSNGKATPYTVRPIPCPPGSGVIRAFRLRKPDGTTYDVAQYPHGCECDCGDWIYNRDGIDPAGCKHVRSLAAVKLIETEAVDGDHPSRWPDWTDADRWGAMDRAMGLDRAKGGAR